MADDHQGHALAACLFERLEQGVLGGAVQVRVRLVEYHQTGVAVERTRQCEVLALSGRQQDAGLADVGGVAIGQPQNRFVHPCHHGGAQHCRVVDRVAGQAGDVLAHRASEELQVLGQIADPRTEFIGVALRALDAIQAHRARAWRGDSGDHLGQGRLAGAAGPDDAQEFSRRQRQRNPFERESIAARHTHHDALELQRTLRSAERHRLASGLMGLCIEGLVDSVVRVPRIDHVLPGRDDHFQRGQRAPHQHRAGNDRADHDLVLEVQVGAQPVQPDLQQQSHELGQCAADAGAVGAAGQRDQRFVVALSPLRDHRRHHAHRRDRIGIAHELFDAALGMAIALERRCNGAAGDQLVADRDDDQQQAACQREVAEHWVKQVDDQHIQRHEGCIEQVEDSRPREKAAQFDRVAKALGAAPRGASRLSDDRVQHLWRELRVERDTDADQQPRADEIESRLDQQREDRRAGQQQQCVLAAAGQHVGEDGQHVQRQNQHQHVEEDAEQPQHRERRAVSGQDPVQCLMGHGWWVSDSLAGDGNGPLPRPVKAWAADLPHARAASPVPGRIRGSRPGCVSRLRRPGCRSSPAVRPVSRCHRHPAPRPCCAARSSPRHRRSSSRRHPSRSRW